MSPHRMRRPYKNRSPCTEGQLAHAESDHSADGAGSHAVCSITSRRRSATEVTQRVTRAGGLLSPLRYRDFRLLWIAQVSSEVGDWAARLALVVVVTEQTHSVVLSALVTAVSVIPFVGIGPLLATYANRFTRLRTILVTDIGRAIIFVILAVPMPVVAVFVLAFVAGCLTPPFEAARNALTPLTVPRERFGDAVALSNITVDLSVLGGYAAGRGTHLDREPTDRTRDQRRIVPRLGSTVVIRTRRRVGAIERGRDIRVRDAWHVVLDDPFVRRFFVSYTITSVRDHS